MQAVQDTTTPTSIKIQLMYTALVSLFYIILPNYLIHIYSKQDWLPIVHILCKQEQMYTHMYRTWPGGLYTIQCLPFPRDYVYTLTDTLICPGLSPQDKEGCVGSWWTMPLGKHPSHNPELKANRHIDKLALRGPHISSSPPSWPKKLPKEP
jgi:hypothetical protein